MSNKLLLVMLINAFLEGGCTHAKEVLNKGNGKSMGENAEDHANKLIRELPGVCVVLFDALNEEVIQ